MFDAQLSFQGKIELHETSANLPLIYINQVSCKHKVYLRHISFILLPLIVVPLQPLGLTSYVAPVN